MSRLAVVLALALVPMAAALPAACADPCIISSDGTFGYNPVVAQIASGASVVWTAADYTHLTADGGTLLSGDPCFFVFSNPGEPSPATRFDLADGALVATTEGVSLPCTTATVTAAGAVLPYYCVLHPTMRGSLVVT